MKVKFNQEIIFVSVIASYSAFKKEEKKINLILQFPCILTHHNTSKQESAVNLLSKNILLISVKTF